VNLIGEHTDYNDGFALPFALAVGATATVSARDDGRVEVTSAQQTEPVVASIGDLNPRAGGWAGYALGVVWALRQRGTSVPGLSIALDSDVPVGAGLSSSAALVCSVATAVDDLLGLRLPADELLAVTRSAENDFVGAPTGGMDQLAALRCTAGHALFCDMRTLATDAVPFELGGRALVVVDTRAEHRHADGEYRRRREGCERAARALGVAALRDVDAAGLATALARLDDDELRRYTRHIVTENDRVLRVVAALRSGAIDAVGPLLNESHASMRDDFRITGPELDLAVDTLVAAGAIGARMTGGGFGGSVIALIDGARVEAAVAAVVEAFARRDYTEPGWFVAEAGQGAHKIEGDQTTR
jgi:galactokinase